MSVTKVTEAHGSPTGAEENEKGEVTYRRRFVVHTSDWRDGPVTVLAASGVPRIGDPFQTHNEGDSKAKCRRRNPSRDPESQRVWFLECEYGPLDLDKGGGGDNGGDNGGDADSRVTQISTNAVTVMMAVDVDIFGDLVTNSAGDKFEDAAEIEVTHPTVSVRRYEDAGANILTPLYVNAINEDQFMGVDMYHAMCRNIRGIQRFEDFGEEYWEAEYEFEFAPESFLFYFLDQGFYTYPGFSISQNPEWVDDPSAVSRQRIMDANNAASRVPVNLDGAGGLLPFGAKPKFLRKHLRRQVMFAPLQMPWLRVRMVKDERWK